MKRILAGVGVWLFSVLASPVHAATYCVDTNLDLATALAAAAASSADDVIKVRTGSYSGLGAIDREVVGALTISGGWGVSCLLRSESATTSINGSSNNFKLTLDNNDLLLLGLTFSGWSQVILSDQPLAFGPPTAEIRVSRSRFTNGSIGLFINAGAHNIVVENSRFDAYSDSGLRIYRTTESFGSADVLLQFNTLSSPSEPGASGLRVQASADAPDAGISIYNTVMNGNQFDLRISDQPVRVRHSFWNTELFTAPGGLAPGSGSNFNGDPGLDAAFKPIEPSSPLINNGVSLVGSTPSTDFDGGARMVGVRPDIGAYESSVLGTTVITVTSVADSGAGSMRAAITAANAAPGDAVIQFNIPGACPRIISLSSSLPTIAKSVRIEGYSQPGSEENSDPTYFDGTVCVFLVGNNALNGGLNLITDEATDTVYVSGMGFYGFTDQAILIAGLGKAQVRGSMFGTGALIFNQNFADSVIRVVDAPGTVIGGDTHADRNVIGGGDEVGVRLYGTGPRTVKYNLIGTNTSGSNGISNGIGVRVEGSIGDNIRNNTIAFNVAQGVLLVDGANAPQGTEIVKNAIGASGIDLSVGGNGGNAIRVAGGSGHEISSNRIYNNGTDGIAVLADSRRVRIIGNRFVNNARLPIDLSPNGRNFNDLDVGQTGANDRQNFPSLFNTGGTPTEGSTRVQLSSANGTYIAQIYAGERCTGLGGSGHDDAGVLLATSLPFTLTCATPSSNCTGSVVVPLVANALVPALGGQFISAIVWDEENNTSEFSICFPYQLDDMMFRDQFE
jgi:hypothetical protein